MASSGGHVGDVSVGLPSHRDHSLQETEGRARCGGRTQEAGSGRPSRSSLKLSPFATGIIGPTSSKT